MLVGHLAVGFAVKRAEPRLSLTSAFGLQVPCRRVARCAAVQRACALLSLTLAFIGLTAQNAYARDETIAVTLSDVDHDHDLDLVVTALPSRTVLHVWLNDGYGRFRDAALPAERPGAPQVDGERAHDADAAADSTPRRTDDGVRSGQIARLAVAPLSRLTATDRADTSFLRAHRLGSRAPPRAA